MARSATSVSGTPRAWRRLATADEAARRVRGRRPIQRGRVGPLGTLVLPRLPAHVPLDWRWKWPISPVVYRSTRPCSAPEHRGPSCRIGVDAGAPRLALLRRPSDRIGLKLPEYHITAGFYLRPSWDRDPDRQNVWKCFAMSMLRSLPMTDAHPPICAAGGVVEVEASDADVSVLPSLLLGE